MIEMLGVLAIIAVLSVGGIAGYSKAMQKHKVNKWSEDVVMLISNLSTLYMNSSTYTDTNDKDLTVLYKELNIVPTNMLDEQNRDVFGNVLRISAHIPSKKEFGSRLFLYFWTLPNYDSVAECKYLFDFVGKYDEIWATVLNESYSGKIGGTLSVCGKSAPDTYANWVGCVPYNIVTVAEKCSVCATQNCDINLVISNGY